MEAGNQVVHEFFVDEDEIRVLELGPEDLIEALLVVSAFGTTGLCGLLHNDIAVDRRHLPGTALAVEIGQVLGVPLAGDQTDLLELREGRVRGSVLGVQVKLALFEKH